MARAIVSTVAALLAVAASASLRPLYAGDASASDSVYTLPPIVIEGRRVPLRGDDVVDRSGFVAVLDVGRRADRVEDLSSVLSKMVGVRVRQYGGLGSFATTYIRGSSSSQVDVYLDGIPLNDAWSGITNLGDLPLDGVEQVEVYRGFTPPQLGGASIGGAVNIVTQRPDASAGTRLHLQEAAGSWGTVRHVASLWSGYGPAILFLHGSHLRSRGDFEFVDDNGTPHNPDDDETVTRHNNDFKHWNLLARLTTNLSAAGSLALGYDGMTREEGVPGAMSQQARYARADRSRHMATARWTPPALFGRRLQTEAGTWYTATNEQLHDREGELSFAPQDSDNDFRTAGGRARATYEVSFIPLAVEALYEGRRETFTPRNKLPQPREGPERGRVTHQGSVSGDVFLLHRRAVLTASQHFMSQTTEFYDEPRFPWLPASPQGTINFSEQTPRFGFRLHALPFFTVKGNWGEYIRQPTMLELFGNTGSVSGNGTLVPEAGTNRDIGVVLSADRLGALRNAYAEVIYLDNEVDDLILFIQNSQFTTKPENISSARVTGWEVSGAANLRDWLRVGGNYAYLDSRDTSAIPFYSGNALPGRPRHDGMLFLEAGWRRWQFSYEWNRIGANYLDRANFFEVPARHIHNASARVNFFSGILFLTVGGANLSDERVHDVNGFPLPGRSFYMSLNFQP